MPRFLRRLLIGAILIFSIHSFASPVLQEGYRVVDPDKKYLKDLNRPDLVIDHLNSKGYEVYGPKGLRTFLEKSNITFVVEPTKVTRDYMSPEDFAAKLQTLVNQYPNLAKMFSIGKSTQGRDLWFVKISTDVQQDKLKPEFKYISTMHGDEITGREAMYSLIEDLLKNYGTDPTITSLVENTAIYIMPNMNPDGTTAQQRYNANGTDLNRDFPDFNTADNKNTPDNRAPETQSIMKFEATRNFSLSANFHGGSEVVNYPWDAIPDNFPFYDLVVNMSLDYSKRATYIYQSTQFQNGITNGYAWYLVNGGMQDWSYHYHNDLQLTIELSDVKWPDFSQMNQFYKDNRSAMLNMISTIQQGAGFNFSDPNVDGTVQITNTDSATDLGTFNFTHSQFYKVLEPGKYEFKVSTSGGVQKSIATEVKPYAPINSSVGHFIKL